ncbi:hypothetical protein GOBAR_DD13865 [Gossypium barbadense]|nr:hypothetical protein GOBAR_DD13865 [Gossypium barbadense]
MLKMKEGIESLETQWTFCEILEDLLLVDVKTSNGWFTWTNNREGPDLVKERLDRFLISEDIVEKMAFLTNKVICIRWMRVNGHNRLRSNGLKKVIGIPVTSMYGPLVGRKRIVLLKDSHGKWHEDKKEICNIAWSYLNDLFKTTTTSYGDVDLHLIPECITDSMNSSLNREFTDEEILAAFKHMDPHKDLGFDGLLGSFFKEHWNQRSEVEVFTRILDTFEKMSGQSINFEKSMVYFIPNTLMPHRTNFGGLLKMKVVTKLDGYLGLPIPIGKKKSSVFKSILDCTTASRINCWSKRLLPNGGKEIFVKSIHQLIPTYAFLVFLGPKGVLKELQSMISQMWWGSR